MPAEYLDSPPGLHVGRELSDDAQMTGAQLDRSPGRPLRTAAIAGLTFTVLYLVHRILQAPDRTAPPRQPWPTTTSRIGLPCWPARSP